MSSPTIELMASGNLSLTITEDVSWESFPKQAEAFVQRFSGSVLIRINTGVDRMWIVLIKWRPFFLTFEDLPIRMTLDSMSRFCNPVIRTIY
jgi:hypothetical protein